MLIKDYTSEVFIKLFFFENDATTYADHAEYAVYGEQLTSPIEYPAFDSSRELVMFATFLEHFEIPSHLELEGFETL